MNKGNYIYYNSFKFKKRVPGLHEGPGRWLQWWGGGVANGEKVDREPRMHIMADLIKEKFNRTS